jgi:hypothetical protein
MSSRPYGGRLTVSGTRRSLTQLLQDLDPTFRATTLGEGLLRADDENVDKVYVELVGGEELGFLRPGEELGMPLSNIYTDKIFLRAAIANDAVDLFGVEW